MKFQPWTRLIDEDAAYCAIAWYSGNTQREIASLYGYATATPISNAIRAFVRSYHPTNGPSRYPTDRNKDWLAGYDTAADAGLRGYGESCRPLIPAALARFVQLRELALTRSLSPHPKDPLS